MKQDLNYAGNIKLIEIKNARVNNLKHIDLQLPRGRFIVITGVSGSGKSSLAFDTIYAEGQRRYVESLSSYARQFLGRMPKPECDYIHGLPPAIAIEQKVVSRNSRSTVGTSTEIYDYLRLLFARVGHTFSPISGKEVKEHSIDEIVSSLLQMSEGIRIAVCAPVSLPAGRNFSEQLEIWRREGFSRLERDGKFLEIEEILEDNRPADPSYYNLLIDRLSINSDKETASRLADSIQTAYFEGDHHCIIKVWPKEGGEVQQLDFSSDFAADGMEFRRPTDLMFNFNNPYGACAKCEGFGMTIGIDEDLVVPDKTLSIYQGAVQCWRGEKMGEWKQALISSAASIGFNIHKPYIDLSRKQKDILWHGKDRWPGIDGFFRWVDENQYKIQYRVLKARYRGRTVCPECHGSRLRPDALYVKVNGHTIVDLVKMPVKDLRKFFRDISLSDSEKIIAKRLLTEINNRLQFLDEVGLGYLTLDRVSSTLSGGESQRINLATSLGSGLIGSVYILDEPSIGLHPRDTKRLIGVLRRLQKMGNTVVVVEHDEEIIREADFLVDVGPLAGRYGGEVVYAGVPPVEGTETIAPNSLTIQYLDGRKFIPYDSVRRPWHKRIHISGARQNNLKNIDVDFPIGVMTVVTGVSGSGKSTLVRDILFKAINRHLGNAGDAPGTYGGISGDLDSIQIIEFVDQNPIAASSRSNAATYMKAYDDIRTLMGMQPAAKRVGLTSSWFSFNYGEGRCPACNGEGTVTIPMQFMADIVMPCETCHGKRFVPEVLEVTWNGKNIYDILQLTVDDAIIFFSNSSDSICKKIVQKLQPLSDVGLGYITLGQPSSTLSGGENQRLKLAFHLMQKQPLPTLFIFDEPTTGLHFNDISTLLSSLRKLTTQGHTVLIIEHNLDVIKNADWIIDLGPEGGENGGEIVATGTPEQVAANNKSLTGRYLAPYLCKAGSMENKM